MKKDLRKVTAHPRLILLVTVLVFAFAAYYGSDVADKLDPYSANDPASESVKTDQAIEKATGLSSRTDLVAVIEIPKGAAANISKHTVELVVKKIRRQPLVRRVVTTYNSSDGRRLVAKDGRSTFILATFRKSDDKRWQDTAERIANDLEGQRGVTVGGSALAQRQINQKTSEDIARAEMIAFPILLLLSFLFFRSLVAALLPLLIGALAIVISIAALRLISNGVSISVFALNLVTGLGLGLAIDYSLLMLSRFREELAKSPKQVAIVKTMATAGRTVLFSSATVAASMAALLIFPQRFLYSMGYGGVLVTAVAALAALVVLPAVLLLLGSHVNALAPTWLQRRAARDARPDRDGFWYRLASLVMRRPATFAVVITALLIALGSPFLSVKFASVDPSVLPPAASSRLTDEKLASDFTPHANTPVTVVVKSTDRKILSQITRRISGFEGVGVIGKPDLISKSLSRLAVVANSKPSSASSQSLVKKIRATNFPVEVTVSGLSAEFIDDKHSLVEHIPYAIIWIIVTTFIALFLMTGSLFLPIKALLMNFLTVCATYGVLVLIFQDGRFENLLDYTSRGGLELTQPVFLFATVFGLSTDYGVFLLARIKEQRDQGASNEQAVALGLERTGRIVTAAALLFCVALGAFVSSQIEFMKELGFGIAFAVLLDATLVRALLVPALMRLLGEWNWWAPGPLRRLHARVGLSHS